MTHKKITMVINANDLRKVAANILSNILGRFDADLKHHLQNLNATLASGTATDVLKSLESLLVTFNKTGGELGESVPLLKEIEDLLPSLAANTEVVEDLPDLLEDSSGVG